MNKNVDINRIEESIQQLDKYVIDASIKPVILILEAMKKDPEDESLLAQLTDALNDIGITKGAVLTYAPYVAILVSYDLFEDD